VVGIGTEAFWSKWETANRILRLLVGFSNGVITEREFIDAVRAQVDLLGVEVGR
jgi:hypothetical protein